VTDYRRNFLSAGSYFFTVNLAERRLALSRLSVLMYCGRRFAGYELGIRSRLELL
jgi:hypothetical protein